MNHLTLKY